MNHSESFARLDRRSFLRNAALFAGFAALRPLHAYGRRVAETGRASKATGFGPLYDKGDLLLPKDFHYEIISWQGKPMSNGDPTPGIFDGMGAYSATGRRVGRATRTILIRNHEHRELPGEQRVIAGPGVEYDAMCSGGNTKLVVDRTRSGEYDPETGRPLYKYEVVEDFAILGGTSTNCAGGEMPYKRWITCEEVVKRTELGKKHGYIFEIDALANAAVPAVPVLSAGRMQHEAVAWANDALYLTEDRFLDTDPLLGPIGACFYRFIPNRRPTPTSSLAVDGGVLQALRLKNEIHANMDVGRKVGMPFPVEWVTVDEPDHEDDTDNRRDRVPGFTPTRIQAQDKGAAFFDRLEGAWATGSGTRARIYFDCTTGGAANLGQVWEYNSGAQTLTLVYESRNPETLRNPDNLVVVPRTRDLLLCEDAGGQQFIRGLTPDGSIYDFAGTTTNQSEFCGACFDRAGQTLFVNQQGFWGDLPDGPPGARAVTYAIYGPFWKRRR